LLINNKQTIPCIGNFIYQGHVKSLFFILIHLQKDSERLELFSVFIDEEQSFRGVKEGAMDYRCLALQINSHSLVTLLNQPSPWLTKTPTPFPRGGPEKFLWTIQFLENFIERNCVNQFIHQPICPFIERYHSIQYLN
jgi:hypothetical protein